MSPGNDSRGLILPLIGIMLIFAPLGPPVGGVLFAPFAVILKPPVAAGGAVVLSALIAALLGHTVLMLAAYVVGIGPAAATGFLYALWDAVAPERWPRALAAAVIGGVVAYAMLLRLAAIGASVQIAVEHNMDPSGADWTQSVFAGRLEGTLAHAFVACGAVAGFVSAMAASLVGLTMRPAPAQPSGAG